MKVRLADVVSKITYSEDSNEEVLKEVIQHTKNNRGLKLIQSKKACGSMSDEKIKGILRRQSKKRSR